MAIVIAVCISAEKGTAKKPVPSGVFRPDWGIEGDAHGGNWHRQVSLLSQERVEEFRARGIPVDDGAFGENLLVSGIDFRRLPVGTRFFCGSVVLELTQIGKECHAHCEIFHAVGDCIMPREGVFAKVLCGGTIAPGDELRYEFPFRAAVLTVSDSAANGTRADRAGPAVEELLAAWHYPVVARAVLPDDCAQLAAALTALCDSGAAELVLTTGGTGFAPRDVTPEATRAIIGREAPGIAEAMRSASLQITHRAMLSRAVAGLRGGALIINLPGSPKAATECLAAVLPALSHGLDALRGQVRDCGESQ